MKGNGTKKGRKVGFEFKLDPLRIGLVILSGLFVFMSVGAFLQTQITENQLELSRAIKDIKEDKVEKVLIENDKLLMEYKDGSEKITTKESDISFTELLDRNDIDPGSVQYTIGDQTITKAFGEILSIAIPLGLTGLVLFFILRAQNRGAQDIFSFGRSKARLFAKGKQDVTFGDVAGIDDAKKELEEVVDFLKNPAKYRKMGARTPKGVLLSGPSGVGKTLISRAVAGEAGVPFFSMAGSEFMEMLVGVGASVTGDTPVLVKKDGIVELTSIGEFIDRYYKAGREGLAQISGVEVLGLRPDVNGFWGSRSNKRPVFGGSKWQPVQSVFRHKVKEIYEIEYLGGKLKTTGDHSVFVREQGGIREKETRQLKPGDVLVNLPMNTRAWNGLKTMHSIKKHEFTKKAPEIYLDVWQDDPKEIERYDYAITMQGQMSQYTIAHTIGVSQATVGNWQRGIYKPQLLSKKAVKLNLPDKVKVTPGLMRLLGYYTAEGRGAGKLEFTFSLEEGGYVEDVFHTMIEVFGLSDPKLEITDTNTVRVTYYSAHLGRFFATYCGLGSHNKHVPSFIWDLPYKYFIEYLKGYWRGDGYETKSGKLSMTSVSHQLIRELAWLCSMHGIKVGIKHEFMKAGRIIQTKPLPASECWDLIIGKTSNPFRRNNHPYQFKRLIVRSINKRKFEGYVYDFCGVEQEAFFGGEIPVLLHNSRVRDLFATAKAASPSIIFIDEIDAIGRQRGRGVMGGHDEREQTLNQILVEMDGFTPNDATIVLAATNRPDLLDPALLRPGRFDRRVTLDMPDKEGRLAILSIHSKGKKFGKGINWERIADRTVGFSGADIENMLNEAAILAARENKAEIDMKDIEESATKVKLGPAKRRLQTKEDRRITAYHEGGHAIVAHYLKNTDPVHRISIVARGMSLGHTEIPPGADRTHETKGRLIDTMAAMLGGRAAEQMVFNEMTAGAASDIKNVTKYARAMVAELGMSPLGPVNLGPQSDFGDGEWYEPNGVSPATAEKVDNEIKRLIDSAYKVAALTIKKNKKKLDAVANALLEKETLDRDDFEKIVGKKK